MPPRADHAEPRPRVVPETAVVAFSKEEATRLRMPGDRVALAVDDVAKREALNARLARAHRV